MTTLEDHLKTVEDFFFQFYKDEPNDTRAASKAMKTFAQALEYMWEVRGAFSAVIEAKPANGILTRLIVENARRDVFSDEEALEFIRQVYDDAYLDDAVDVNEMIREHESIMKDTTS